MHHEPDNITRGRAPTVHGNVLSGPGRAFVLVLELPMPEPMSQERWDEIQQAWRLTEPVPYDHPASIPPVIPELIREITRLRVQLNAAEAVCHAIVDKDWENLRVRVPDLLESWHSLRSEHEQEQLDMSPFPKPGSKL